MTPTSYAQNAKNEDNLRLRKASEFIDYCKTAENEARRALAEASERTKLARTKHETLFLECEKRALARRKAGLIEFSAGY